MTALVENSSFELKVDSGAKCNVISDTTIKSLSFASKPRLNTQNGVELVTYSKDTIPTLGTCVLHCKISYVLFPLKFQVVKGDAKKKNNPGFERKHSNLISFPYILMCMKSLHHHANSRNRIISRAIFGVIIVSCLATNQAVYR